jgi:hypothetical protein
VSNYTAVCVLSPPSLPPSFPSFLPSFLPFLLPFLASFRSQKIITSLKTDRKYVDLNPGRCECDKGKSPNKENLLCCFCERERKEREREREREREKRERLQR